MKEVTTNLRVTLTGGNGADLVATEGWDPSANSGAGGAASGVGTSSQFYSDLINCRSGVLQTVKHEVSSQ